MQAFPSWCDSLRETSPLCRVVRAGVHYLGKNPAGELISGQVMPMQSWEVFLCGAHSGYTS